MYSRKHIVRETKHGIVFPKGVPPERTNLHKKIFVFLCVIALGVTSYDLLWNELLFEVIYVIYFYFIIEIMYRLAIFIQECNYLQSRYENSMKLLITDITHLNSTNFLLLFGSTFIVLIAFVTSSVPEVNFNILRTDFVLALICYLLNHANIMQNPVGDSMVLETSTIFNMGSHMALHYFYGYLKLLIPSDGQDEKGFKVFVRQYESHHGVSLINKVLYILIPMSLHCPQNLVFTSKFIKESSPLESVRQNVAGVLKRSYRNQVYKIDYDGEYYYVCAEYVSTLTTFKKIIMSNAPNTEFHKRHIKDITYGFYKTLRQLIEDDVETRGLCKLIYYEDEINGTYMDVGEILLHELAKGLRSQSSRT